MAVVAGYIVCPMDNDHTTPLVGVTSCLKSRDEVHFHSVGDKYVDAVVVGAAAVPVLIPAIGERLDPDELLERLDGLMVTGSPSNVDPNLYGGPPAREGNEADPARDATTLPLITCALARAIPVLCICRGLQELNVALGGSLHQLVHEQPGRLDHREPESAPRHLQYSAAHGIRLAEGGLLRRLLGAPTALVNSIHAQGIDRLAPGLSVEATAPDGLIEAVRVEGASFALGVQWHPEWRFWEDRLATAIFAAFGTAARAYAARSVSSAAA